LGKIWDLLQERRDEAWCWDCLVLDAPATGHGLALLGAPRAMMDLTRSGPFFANAARVQTLIEDPLTTAVVLTALPEPLPVTEAIELARGLGPARTLLRGCVLNQVHAPPFGPLSAWPSARARLAALDHPAWREAVGLVDNWVAQARRQEEARERLDRELGLPRLELSALPARSLGLAELTRLADRLGQGGGGTA
jgi:anion-transporting  ArsA/GET3 family ATPase